MFNKQFENPIWFVFCRRSQSNHKKFHLINEIRRDDRKIEAML